MDVAVNARASTNDREFPARIGRVSSVDVLRGLVMIVMALDHTRDFFASSGVNPRDVAEPALFLTRWITHFCAPVFVFLAGVSAFLHGANGRSLPDLSRFLATRGLWLILIELTVVRLAWTFSLDLNYFFTQVIFAIGASMIVLSMLIHLPRQAVAAIGLTLIAGHNLLDPITSAAFGNAAPVWNVLHEPAMLQFGNVRWLAVYPLIPWIGVMAAGYALGPVFLRPRHERMRLLMGWGLAVTVGFVVLRATNLYGDPASWTVQPTIAATILSFINCEKYPPSLLYLMMTLGPALLALAALESVRGRTTDWVTVFGRVPFFYYVLHIYLIHALAVLFAAATGSNVGWLFGPFPPDKPESYGIGLAGVYVIWLAVVAALYPPCRWFAAVKQRRTDWWLSYL
ncbi:MAG: DUF1624 domain-containing protein [Pseudomonadota bacterium]